MAGRTRILNLFLLLPIFLAGCTHDPENSIEIPQLAFQPTAYIDSPSGGSVFSAGEMIIFTGVVQDIEDDAAGLDVVWISDKDGLLGGTPPTAEGEVEFRTDELSYAEHFIKLRVTNNDGNTGVDSILVFNNFPAPVTLMTPEREGDDVKLTWTSCSIPDFLRYHVYRSIVGDPLLDGELLDFVDGVTDTTYVDDDAPQGMPLRYAVYTENESNFLSGSEVVPFEITDIIIRFQAVIYDAIMHPTEPYLFLAAKYANKVYKVDLDQEAVVDSLEFHYMAEELAIHDTGAGVELYVTLLAQEHSAYLGEEDQEGYIAIVDADAFTEIETFHIHIDPYDVVIGHDGTIYTPSGSGQWTYFDSYSRTTLTQIDRRSIYVRSLAAVHPTDDRIYTLETNIYPQDINVYVVDAGLFMSVYDSPYHGTYTMLPPFALAPTGECLVTGAGTVFRCSSVQAEDLVYLGSLGTTATAFCFAPDRGEILAAVLHELQAFDDQTYAFKSACSTEGLGRHLFLHGEEVVAVVRSPESRLDYLYGVEILTINELDGGP